MMVRDAIAGLAHLHELDILVSDFFCFCLFVCFFFLKFKSNWKVLYLFFGSTNNTIASWFCCSKSIVDFEKCSQNRRFRIGNHLGTSIEACKSLLVLLLFLLYTFFSKISLFSCSKYCVFFSLMLLEKAL